eukprot:4482113-Alexandrium_andersonii.AAC.1
MCTLRAARGVLSTVLGAHHWQSTARHQSQSQIYTIGKYSSTIGRHSDICSDICSISESAAVAHSARTARTTSTAAARPVLTHCATTAGNVASLAHTQTPATRIRRPLGNRPIRHRRSSTTPF